MKQKEIEAILASEKGIVPSRDFARVVMAAVQREAAEPEALEFPWLRALPGMLALMAAIIAMLWNGVASLNDPAEAAMLDRLMQQWLQPAIDTGALWVVLALLLCLVLAAVPVVVLRSRTHLA